MQAARVRDIPCVCTTDEDGVRWRRRYHELGLAGIEKDAPRPGRKKAILKRTVNKVIKLTTQEKPANATQTARSQDRAV